MPEPGPGTQPVSALARVDGLELLRHMLLVVAFCLAIAALQVAFVPERPYGPPAAHSLAIGLITWAVVDIGRHFFPSAAETGWPSGVAAAALVVSGIAAGWLLGSPLGDLICRSLDLYRGLPPLDPMTELRNGVLTTIIAGLVGSYYFYTTGRGAWLERQAAEARHQATRAQLKLLEAQLEPHMLFNTLANLRALIATDPARAQAMLDRLDGYLRATLAGSRAETHPLSTEFERLRDYLELMVVRMGPRLRYRLELPPALATQPVPALLLQPLVENAIRHGLEPSVAGGEITVSARQDGDDLVLTVQDTGVGLAQATHPGPPATATHAGGFGLDHVRERLASLHGDLGRFELRAIDTGGARAVVRFPLDSGRA